MARSGYCSNEQIMKLALKRYKHQACVVYTPLMMYMEEYIVFMQEQLSKHDFSMSDIAKMARCNWKRIKKCDKLPYKQLADLANSPE